jgi:hypothetical protein
MPNTQKVDSVVIHMYTMGTGDCFVLKFMKAGRVSFKMLIDCGVWSGTYDHIRDFVRTLKQDVDNHVDVLVVTHEHKDHVFGFQAAQALFTDGEFTADRIWMGWTEDDDDAQVKRWKRQHGQKKRALALAAKELKRVVGSNDFKKQFSGSRFEKNLIGMRAQFAAVLDEFADLHVNQAAGDRQYIGSMEGLRVVKDEIGTDRDQFGFLSPGDILRDQVGLEGVNIFVLGPPKLFEEVKKEHGDHEESYEHNREIDEDDLLIDAFNAMGSTAGDSLGHIFDSAYVTSRKEDRELYDDGEAWRRIDYDWIFSSGQLALRMNSLTNNLSLALAFEFEDNGKVMLFPGDAEFGSWKSWHDINWGQLGETAFNSDKPLTTENLLNRTVFYKVAHHLSHNGTARSVGLDMMTSPELVAMATLDYDVISSGWKSTMPNQLIVKELLEKTHGRTIIMNENGLLYDRQNEIKLSDKIKEFRSNMSAAQRSAFQSAVKVEPHFIEYILTV